MPNNATAKLPSQAGRKALLNIAAGRPANFGMYGGACHDGRHGVMWSLRLNGFIDHHDQLTETGLQMVERLTVAPEVAHVA